MLSKPCRRREKLRNIRLLRHAEPGIVAFSPTTRQGQVAFGGDYSLPLAQGIFKYPFPHTNTSFAKLNATFLPDF